MQTTRPLSERARLVLQWYEATKSARRTADRVPCSLQYVYSLLHRTGTWVHADQRRPLRGKENKIRRLYLRGLTLSQLADKFHVSKVAIFKAVRRAENTHFASSQSDRSSEIPANIHGGPRATRHRFSPHFPSSSEINRRIGARIRRRRNALQWSRAKLARALKVTPRQVHALETGGIGITIGTLFALSRAFGTPPWSIVNEAPLPNGAEQGRGEATLSKDMCGTQITREASQLLAAYHRIKNSAVRKQIHELVTLLGSR